MNDRKKYVEMMRKRVKSDPTPHLEYFLGKLQEVERSFGLNFNHDAKTLKNLIITELHARDKVAQTKKS